MQKRGPALSGYHDICHRTITITITISYKLCISISISRGRGRGGSKSGDPLFLNQPAASEILIMFSVDIYLIMLDVGSGSWELPLGAGLFQHPTWVFPAENKMCSKKRYFHNI